MRLRMKIFLTLTILISCYCSIFELEGSMFHSQREENIEPFDELFLTWNGKRPSEGVTNFYVRLKTDTWSPYLLYARWGASEQSSFSGGGDVKVYQDAVITKTKATGYEIKVEGAEVQDLRFHIFVNHSKMICNEINPLKSIQLQAPGISQMLLNHPRAKDLCSPTSTTAVIQFLTNQKMDPIFFANSVWDSGFDIYGNWVLNLAQASSLLGNEWNCWVEKLSGFQDLHARLMKNTPVVVSVRGPLAGSALPYAKGHLLVVSGYDSENQQVFCMDPAFPKDEQTKVAYPVHDFIEAWSRRGFVSYIFEH